MTCVPAPGDRSWRASMIGRVGALVIAVIASAVVQAQPAPASAQSASSSASSANATPRYTFSWPAEAGQPKPRGGISQGPPVVLDTAPSPAWQALQAPGLTAPERDRHAILAMAGTYRVSFDFIEVASFGAAARPAPYQSWGTEKVYVDRDEPGFVRLVHILEMRIVGNDGKTSEPFVTKHWRQDWAYEPESLVEYRGAERWQRRLLGADERRGAWLQTVHQVDESPRYAALGHWNHTTSFSTWLSAETWRPLPRREWSVRSDYQVLVGSNRHTVVPTGWLQEENNLKAVVPTAGLTAAAGPYVGREYGVARYERIRAGTDFAEADRYYAKTRAFWNEVVGAWDDAFRRQGAVTLRGPVDQLGLFVPLFERADRIAASGDAGGQPGDFPAGGARLGDSAEIRAIVDSMQAPR